MRTSFFGRPFAVAAIVALVVALAANQARGQAPTGAFGYVFTNLPIWDTTGTYTNTSLVDGATDNLTVVITNEASGLVTGTRTESLIDGGEKTYIHAPFTGKVFVKHGVTGAALKITSGVATGVFDGVDYTATVKGGSIATIDPSTLTVLNTGKQEICPKNIKGVKCTTLSGTEPADLPAGMTGDWTLENDIAASGDKLSGTGMVTLSNGRVLTNLIVGTFTTRGNASKLKLVGIGDAMGTSLSLVTTGTAMDVVALKGKILGQKPTLVP